MRAGDVVRQRGDTRFQFLMQGFQFVNIEIFALTFTEFRQQTFSFLLLAQALFQFAQSHTQRLRLFRQVTLVNAFAQQFARHVPGLISRQRAIDRHHQLIGLLELTVRGLRHAHFLFQRKHFFGGFLLFRLEGFQPLGGAISRQIRQMAHRSGALQRRDRLVVLDGAGLLNVQRLLVIRQLAFQLIHFQLGSFSAGFVFFLTIGSFRHHFVLFFETDLQLVEIRSITFNFFLLTQRRLHQVQVIARRLIIGFEIAFRAVVLAQLTRHVDVFILLRRQLFARRVQFATEFQGFIEVDPALIGVAHIVRRHIVGGFADQVFKQIAIGLGHANSFQRQAVFPQRGFHILERLTHPAVFRQQVVAQRTGDRAGNPAVQRGFNQAIEFTTVRRRAQTTGDEAQVEHQRMVIGDRVELLKLHAFHLVELLFQLRQRQDACLTFIQRLRHQLRGLHRHRQSLNGKRFDIDFTVASGNLLQTHTHHHALMARVDRIQHRITDTRFQLTVQTFIARAAGRACFGGVTEVQQG